MQKIRNNTLKALVVMALFSATAFAEGDMGGGGFAESDSPTKTPVVRSAEGDMGGGGRSTDGGYIDSLLTSIYDYFEGIL